MSKPQILKVDGEAGPSCGVHRQSMECNTLLYNAGLGQVSGGITEARQACMAFAGHSV